ncbi:filamentous hemagglutinin N-terminal domain-containing protein [Nostoc sp. KVJ3]|uniref:S-layer family protein n=1 Tax=Nostoc sp. KVJ3 TaxID=457945 RepID=UPI0022377A83|nr:S-layer family protein [Nostoc sp. KVJ3]MCW5318219.1 filamentous hemagglutinin N-terminal domain-containing protein [Nostoc sp. KVJ3]
MSRKLNFYSPWGICGISLSCLFPSSSALAQIIPDNTFGSESSVVTQTTGSVHTISGGATRGANLFHSFQNFSILTGHTAYFNNSLNIQNIIARVTGGAVSNIDGLIKANGTANLFLINPNGFIFGSNAKINIGSSFLTTTANTIKFGDGTFFSAAPEVQPLLTISVPIGLVFVSNPGAIQIQGSGHSLVNPIFSPITGLNNNSTGLQVQPGKTLALVGGDIALDGGILTAQSGQIELGSVGDGLVSLTLSPYGFRLGYQGVQDFKDIQLSHQALVNASGAPGGSIEIQGQRISVSDGSAILIQNQGEQVSGGINVNASDSLEVNGTSLDGRIASTLLTETLNNGNGGDITISAKRVLVQDGGQILPRTFGLGTGGNFTVNASDSVQVIGFSPAYPNLFSNISAATFGSGKAGNLTLSTSSFTGTNGIQVGSATFGSGSGGDVTVNAADITLSGVIPNVFTPSTINAATFKNGNAGQVIINSSRLRLENGGAVASSTTASGNAGSVTVNVSDSVVIDGIGRGSVTPSLVDSSAIVLAQPLQQQLRIPSTPSGNSGNVTINTQNLSISNGGLVNVQNNGSGNAGILQINANRINLTNNGGITATSAIGQGGDININSKVVQLQNGDISATAGTQRTNGNGGNIQINTDILVASENSRLTANAYKGRGGNIQINTQGFFASQKSEFTASSALGINGNVQFNILNNNVIPTKAVPETIQLPPEITSACQGHSSIASSKFVIIGTGSAPRTLETQASNNRGWYANSVKVPTDNNLQKVSLQNLETQPIIEAQSLLIEPSGEIKLVAFPNQVAAITSASRSSSCFATGHKPTSISTLFP